MMDAIVTRWRRCRSSAASFAAARPELSSVGGAGNGSTVRRGGGEQSNSSVFFDDYGMLKMYRRLEPGPHPEIEMSRFLVERAGFANTPPPLATIEAARQ